LIYVKAGIRAQILTTIGLLLGYWAAMTLIPVPGVGAGDLSRPNNLAAWLDCRLMPGHTYKSDYDPEGLLSTIPAVATTLIGVLAGAWLSTRRPVAEKVAGLFASGAILMALGAAWGGWFPINKALWTSSFVLLTAGLSLQLLGLCGFLIDVEGCRRWAGPFLVFGSNPIAAYVLSSLLARVLNMVKVGEGTAAMALKPWIYEHAFASWASPTFASFLYAFAYVLLWLAIMAILYRMKLFIRV
jgi:predicted acyltransferase